MRTDYVQRYNYLLGVTLMLFVGFGYLMTFLRWYGLGAVGLAMLIICVGMELEMILNPLFQVGGWSSKVRINISSFLFADFAAATFLISFGALIGKVSPEQLLILVVCESLAFSVNTTLILGRWLSVVDPGGSIAVHMFGAYFGLAASYVLGKPHNMTKERTSPASDLRCFLVTFSWSSKLSHPIPSPAFRSSQLIDRHGHPMGVLAILRERRTQHRINAGGVRTVEHRRRAHRIDDRRIHRLTNAFRQEVSPS